MPSDKEIEIILRLRDEVTKVLQGVQSNLHKFSNYVKEISLDMRKVGREISFVGMSMAAVGTAITASLTLAYKTARNFNAEIAHQLRETQNVFNNLSVEIGKSLLPVMRQLTDSVANLVGWWKGLDQSMKDKIIQNIWNLGKNLLIVGTSLVVIGKAISTLANLGLLIANFDELLPLVMGLVSPLGLAALGFIALTAAMLKWKPIADGVIRTFALLTFVMTAGLINIKPEAMIAGFDNVRQQLIDLDNMAKEIMGSLAGKREKDPAGGFWSGFEKATVDAMDALRDFQQLGRDVANQLTTNLAGAFSSFINDAFSGQLKRAQDYFAEFGKSILKMFGEVVAKMIAQWMMVQAVMAGKQLVGNILGILGNIGGLASAGNYAHGVSQETYGSNNFVSVSRNTVSTPYYHSGGIIRAHGGLNLASDEIPIIAQTGERVLSRKQNAEYERGGGQTVNYFIYAMDASSFAQMLYKNRGSVHAIVGAGMKNNNSTLRRAMKTYG